jgi:Histidine kinase-, DNA gyrase B-, and HSP90-like ATPase
MQQMKHFSDPGNAGHRRVEAVVQTLAALVGPSDSLAEVAHDARNMVTALGLYCDLLDEPGVLAVPFAHYSSELRLVAAASRRLVGKLVALDAQAEAEAAGIRPGTGLGNSLGNSMDAVAMDTVAADGWASGRLPGPPLQRVLDRTLDHGSDPGADPGTGPSADHDLDPDRNPDRLAAASAAASGVPSSRWESIFAVPIVSLAAELQANRNLLAALAGPGVAVTVDAKAGAQPVRLTAEDLTRLLVNMVKNAAEAMPAGGCIHISLVELTELSGLTGWGGRAGHPAAAGRLLLAIEDTGPGIAEPLRSRIFESGFTTHPRHGAPNSGWPATHRGLGLAITRSIVETAGGRITASNRTGTAGARFEIELPVRSS